jgi:hypothetical protein
MSVTSGARSPTNREKSASTVKNVLEKSLILRMQGVYVCKKAKTKPTFSSWLCLAYTICSPIQSEHEVCVWYGMAVIVLKDGICGFMRVEFQEGIAFARTSAAISDEFYRHKLVGAGKDS